jgi:hypothetical protein
VNDEGTGTTHGVRGFGEFRVLGPRDRLVDAPRTRSSVLATINDARTS